MFSSFIYKSNRNKFVKDLNWNVAGFLGSAICGLLLNIIIVRNYDYETLGTFNLLFACFSLISQFASLGIHLSIQKFVPQNFQHSELIGKHLSIALILSLIISIPVAVFAWVFSEIPGVILDNTIIEKGFKYSVAGIIFFAINKIILAYLSGKRLMKMYAFYNFLRPFLMLLFVTLFILLRVNLVNLAYVFLLPELFLTVLLLVAVYEDFKIWERTSFLEIMKFHFKHGRRIAVSNILISFNSKIDILILGFFTSEIAVGIYSFAIFFIDGFSQFIVVFRQNINPLLTRIYFHYNSKMLLRLINIWTRKFYKLFLGLGVLMGALYPLTFFFTNKFQIDNFIIFYGLLVGVLISSGYQPYQYVFNQLGLVQFQSKFFGLIFLLNALANLCLVPFLGLYGSVISFLIVNIFQRQYLKKFLQNIQTLNAY